MPLENGGRQKMLSGETPHLQEDSPRYSGQNDNTDTQPARTNGQNPDLLLGAGREDVNLGQNEQTQEQAYNSEEQRDVYQSREQSFNEQRHNYTEKSFNSYDYEMFIEHVTKTAEYRRAGHADTGGRLTPPPPLPSANPDSELELSEWAQERMDLIGKRISRLEKDRIKNDRKREKLRKKQPSVKKYSIKEGGFVEKKLDERGYKELRRDGMRRSDRREKIISGAKRTGRLLFNDADIEEDEEDAAAVKQAVHKGTYAAKRGIKRNVRNISDKSHVYKRLKFRDKKDSLTSREGQRLKHEQGRILAVNRKMSETDKMCEKSAGNGTMPGTGKQAGEGAANKTNGAEAARRAENRKIQQQKKQRQRIARQQTHIRNESFFRRVLYQHRMKKDVLSDTSINQAKSRHYAIQ